MRSADLGAVLDIEDDSFATPWSARTFLNLLRRPNAALLAAVDVPDRLVGYAVVWFTGAEGELGDIAVSTADRRRGIGSDLVSAVLGESVERGVSELYLEVRESNSAALALYERHGFEVVNRRPNYYSRPSEDALVMRRLLVR